MIVDEDSARKKKISLEDRCRRFVNSVEDYIGFDTLFVFFIFWFALVVELIHYKLFTIGNLNEIFFILKGRVNKFPR